MASSKDSDEVLEGRNLKGRSFRKFTNSDINTPSNMQEIHSPSTTVEDRPSVRLLVQAYTAMLQSRSSRGSTHSVGDYSSCDLPSAGEASQTYKSRYRQYRESPKDRRWLTWDDSQKSDTWLSEPDIREPVTRKLVKAKQQLTLPGLHVPPSDEGCHSDLSPSPTWSNANQLELPPGGNSGITSINSPSGFIDDFPLSRSTSCSQLPVKEHRSMSEDSAVELMSSYNSDIVDCRSDTMELSRSEYTEQWDACNGRDDGDECYINRPRIIPPSVVISDYSGENAGLRCVLSKDDLKLPTLSRQASFVTEPLCEFGLSVSKVCPRKVSDCSTCSSVSTVDMSPESHLTLDEFTMSASRRSSCCSNCSSYTSVDSLDGVEEPSAEPKLENDNADAQQATHSEKTSNWRKVKNVVQWTPFIQTYKRHKYPWVQLAGHQGNFKAGEKQGTILKKLCPAEQRALEGLMQDVLKPFVPEYMGMVESGDQEQYLQLQDLLSDFSAPCVMDIKMGVRTYLEDELAKAREKPKLRKDMFEKMIQIDPTAPSEAEQRAQAVTKPRYMVWRETISSTATLGFRIEGVKKSDGTSSKDFKTTRTQEQVLVSLGSFASGYDHAPGMYLKRLKEIRSTLETSKFFMSHELIGSSLLFVHNEDSAVVWLIDFAKSIPLPGNVSITHRSPWVEGSHEDGYLLGLDNIINLMALLDQQKIKPKEVPQPVKQDASIQSPFEKQEVNQTQNTEKEVTQNDAESTSQPNDISRVESDPTTSSRASLAQSCATDLKDLSLNCHEGPSTQNALENDKIISNKVTKTKSRHFLNVDNAPTKDPFEATADTSSTVTNLSSSSHAPQLSSSSAPQLSSSSAPQLSSSSPAPQSPTDIRNLVTTTGQASNSIS